jgi:ubiquitin C-terminal hydrolase
MSELFGKLIGRIYYESKDKKGKLTQYASSLRFTQAFGAIFPNFDGSSHQDAQEFMSLTLNRLKEEQLRTRKGLQAKVTESQSLESTTISSGSSQDDFNESTIVDATFRGLIFNEVCLLVLS